MLVKQKTQLPSLFYCSFHPFKVISHHTNPPRLLWPLFIAFILQRNPPAYYTPYNSAHESSLQHFILSDKEVIY